MTTMTEMRLEDDEAFCNCCTEIAKRRFQLVGLATRLPYAAARLQCSQLGGYLTLPENKNTSSFFIQDYPTIGVANCSKDALVWTSVVQGSQRPDGTYQWINELKGGR